MRKQEFLAKLRKDLSDLPQDEVTERLTFYSEMIDDRIEEGFSEEEAVGDMGNPDEVIARIISETPLSKLVKEKVGAKRKFSLWEITLLAIGSPIWVSLLIVAAAVIFSLYISLWSIIISLWASLGALFAFALCGIVAGVIFIATGKGVSGITLLSAGLVCAGLSIFAFFCCKAITKGVIFITGRITFAVKKCFIKKEEA